MTTIKSRVHTPGQHIAFSTQIFASTTTPNLAVIKCYDKGVLFHSIEIDLEQYLQLAKSLIREHKP